MNIIKETGIINTTYKANRVIKYMSVRSIAAVLGAEVGYEDKKVILETNH